MQAKQLIHKQFCNLITTKEETLCLVALKNSKETVNGRLKWLLESTRCYIWIHFCCSIYWKKC